MQKSAAVLVRHALERLGVRHVFGVPGVHNVEIYDALESSPTIEPVLVTHEACASFMADAVSRTSGSPGVIVVVPAAGLTHAMSGIGEAFLDGVPLLVISGGVRTDSGRRYQLHDVDHDRLLQALTKARWRVLRHADVVPTIYEAWRVATDGVPGPVFVEIPANLQLFAGDAPDPEGVRFVPPVPPAPDPAAIERAADLLAHAPRPGLFVGWGARHAAPALRRIAERLGAPVATTLQGLTTFPGDHPLHVGMSFGPHAVPAAEHAFDGCDALLAAGTRFAEIASGSYGAPVPRDLVHVDIDPAVPGANFPAKVPIVADAALALDALADALERRLPTPRDSAPLAARIAADKRAYRDEWHAHVPPEDSRGRVNPARFFDALDAHLGADALVVADDGNHTFLCAELLPTPAGRRFVSPTDFNCMGYCVPAAIGAKLADPARTVAGIVGDGAFLMTGMETLNAASRGLGVPFFVFNDGELAQIAQAQQIPFGRRVCTRLAPLDFEAFARATGCEYVAMPDDASLEAGMRRAFDAARAGRPSIVDVRIDYSRRTRFTKGVVGTTLKGFALKDQARFVGRALWRRMTV